MNCLGRELSLEIHLVFGEVFFANQLVEEKMNEIVCYSIYKKAKIRESLLSLNRKKLKKHINNNAHFRFHSCRWPRQKIYPLIFYTYLLFSTL